MKRKKECMIKETRQSYLFILTVLPPLQQLCSPISRSYFKELHNYTILPVMIFIQLLRHTAFTCFFHFENGLLGLNTSQIKLGLQENSKKHIFDKPVLVSKESFLSSFASLALEKREEKDLFSIRLWI